MKVHNKLVRDKIPDIIKNDNKIPNYRILDDKEYLSCLNNKLQEEVNEYLVDEDISEIADILEVINAILNVKGKTLEDVKKIMDKKNLSNGAFDKKIYLESVE